MNGLSSPGWGRPGSLVVDTACLHDATDQVCAIPSLAIIQQSSHIQRSKNMMHSNIEGRAIPPLFHRLGGVSFLVPFFCCSGFSPGD